MQQKRNKRDYLQATLDDVVLFLRLFLIRIQTHRASRIFRKAKNVQSSIGSQQVDHSTASWKTGLIGLRDSQMALRT
jgi:hypothetical protein